MICGIHTVIENIGDCHVWSYIYVKKANGPISSCAARVWPVRPLVFQGDNGFALI